MAQTQLVSVWMTTGLHISTWMDMWLTYATRTMITASSHNNHCLRTQSQLSHAHRETWYEWYVWAPRYDNSNFLKYLQNKWEPIVPIAFSISVLLSDKMSKAGISNPAHGWLSSCRLQFQPCSNTTVCNYQVTQNTLISWSRWVLLGLELKCAEC